MTHIKDEAQALEKYLNKRATKGRRKSNLNVRMGDQCRERLDILCEDLQVYRGTLIEALIEKHYDSVFED